MSLRYDLTAPLARYVAQNYQDMPKPFRRYAVGPVWRNEKPGPGRFRQFMQFDADTVGAESVAADAEMCMLAADTLEALGIKRGDYVIKVNNRKVLDGPWKSLDFRARTMPSGSSSCVRWTNLIGSGRQGSRTSRTRPEGRKRRLHAGCRAARDHDDIRTSRIATRPGTTTSEIEMRRRSIVRHREVSSWTNFFGSASSEAADRNFRMASSELETIAQLDRFSSAGTAPIASDRSSVVRGLEYYTGPVFEAELTFEVKDEKGRPVRFGSVGGGGRYDDLVARFTGQKVPATGFSIGVSRLQAALASLG